MLSTVSVPFLDLGAMHRELSAELDAAWHEALDTSAFIGWPALERFEQTWAARCGRRHAVGVSSGTEALHLTLRALGVGPGDEVLVPGNTFIATAEAVVLCGAEPRFVDVDDRTLLVTPEVVADALTPRTAAVIAVSLYGQPPDLDALVRLCTRAGVPLIEDAAQSHGALWNGRPSGSFGVAGCFSFYPGKNLGALGDAGAVTTDDPQLAETVRSLSDHGRGRGHKYHHPLAGLNGRMDGLQAALLQVKVGRLDAWNVERRRVAATYEKRLSTGRVRTIAQAEPAVSARHLYVVRIPDRDAVQASLADRGIATGVHYPVPCHKQPPYAHPAHGPLPVVEQAAREVLSLPMFPHLQSDQVDRACDALEEALGHG